jgi:hypothetical protein
LRQIFERLQQRKDPKVLEEQQQAVNERTQAILQKAQARLAELVWTLLLLLLGPMAKLNCRRENKFGAFG